MQESQKKEARKIMSDNKVKKLYITSDGQFFLKENPAKNHSLRLHGTIRKKALTIETVTSDDLTAKISTK